MYQFRNRNKWILMLVIVFIAIIGIAFVMNFKGFINPILKFIDTKDDENSVTVESLTDAPEETTVFNYPDRMRAVIINPSEDFLIEENESSVTIESNIYSALDSAVELTMNTVIIPVHSDNYAIYQSDCYPAANALIDPLQCIIQGARSRGLFVYCIYDVKSYYDGDKVISYSNLDYQLLNQRLNDIKNFVLNYSPDGIFLDNYYFEDNAIAYTHYLNYGGGIGYENYLNSQSHTLIQLISSVIRKYAPNIQIGLLTEPQWATIKENVQGNNTTDAFSMLTDGHADVLQFLDENLADVIAVKSFGSLTDSKIPFDKVVSWWSKVSIEKGIRMYAVHAADRMCNGTYEGWKSKDQLAKQIITLEKYDGYEGCNGSIFNSLSAIKKDPNGAATLALQCYTGEVNTDYIMTELSVSLPKQTTYSTYEPTVMFRGASDPSNPVTVNGKTIKTDANGYFSVNYDLSPGLNTFTIVHKDKTIVYKITRNVKIFQSVTPVGNLTVDGSTQITLSAMAYEDASINATINGTTITLTRDNSEDDQTDKDSFYVKYTGLYTTPAASNSVQNLGNIIFKGSWQSINEKETGASIKVNKVVDVSSGSPIVISAAQAETFPINVLNDLSEGTYYPLPKGSLDYTVGGLLSYSEGSASYQYYRLASGVRVYANSISNTSSKVEDVLITGMSVSAGNSYTTVTLSMSQPTSYTVDYDSKGISFNFNYVKQVCGNLSNLTKNPLFKSATWSNNTLTLSFNKSDGMCGYIANYSGNNLVIRFNNIPSGISSARIVIDPGHGGTDPGALGYYPNKNEDYVNRQIASNLSSILTNNGATVKLIDTNVSSGKLVIQTRAAMAAEFNPHIYVSVHCNSATNSSAKGNETFYFYPFSRPLANYVNNGLFASMGNANRGVKYGRYYVTRWTQYSSVLCECGFMSNQDEYVQLLNNAGIIASSLANGISNYFNSIYSDCSSYGTESVGKIETVLVKGVSLDTNTLALSIGEEKTLAVKISPEEATNQTVSWSSSDSTVATIDNNGKVKGIKEGTTVISVNTEDGNYSAKCTVTVAKIDVTSITLNHTASSLVLGQTLQLNATVVPDNAYDNKVLWTSGDASIASVSSDGLVSALKEGTVSITASVGGKSAICEIIVLPSKVSVQGIKIDSTAETICVSEKRSLTVSISPTNATDKGVSWSSSNNDIISVSSGGEIIGVSVGSATITVSTTDGNYQDSVEIQVLDSSVSVTGISMSQNALNLSIGSSVTLQYAILPDNATDKVVIWKSSNADVASVEADGSVLGVSSGTAIISVTTKDGNFKAECSIIVS